VDGHFKSPVILFMVFHNIIFVVLSVHSLLNSFTESSKQPYCICRQQVIIMIATVLSVTNMTAVNRAAVTNCTRCNVHEPTTVHIYDKTLYHCATLETPK